MVHTWHKAPDGKEKQEAGPWMLPTTVVEPLLPMQNLH